MDQPTQIHKATLEEAVLIRKLALDIWPKAFEKILSPTQIAYMLELMYSETALMNDMKRGVEFYILNVDKTDAGYAAIENIAPRSYKLHKIYLSQKLHGKGLGKFLLNQMEQIVLGRQATVLRLNVNRGNQAVEFYKSRGYNIVHTEDIDIGNGFFMNDYVMEKQLH